jgi:glycosyltransferase involved in cell wall biosynthesis
MTLPVHSPVPRVSVLMLTYNHADFIEESLRSVFAQQCAFPFEIVLGDDASTDGTLEKVLELQRERPDLLRVLPAERNLGITPNFMRVLAACRGRTIAMLEGDDCWTDAAKLQRQVAQLEADPSLALSVCRTRHRRFWGPVQERYGLPDLLRRYLFHTSSLVFRKDAMDGFPVRPEIRALDTLLFAHLATRGDCGFIDREMSSYRRHAGGAWSGQGVARQAADTQAATDALLEYFHGKHAAELFERERWVYGMLLAPDLTRPVLRQWAERRVLVRPLLTRILRHDPAGALAGVLRWLLLPVTAGFGRLRMTLGLRTRLARWRAAHRAGSAA